MMNFLITLSESDKRVLIAILLVFIILIILFGYLVKLIKYILNKKADYVGDSMYDLLDANFIKDEKHFRKISFEKNRRKFYFEARIPFLVIVLSWVLIIIYMSFAGFSLDFLYQYTDDILLKLDWSESFTLLLNFIPAMAKWPTVIKIPVFHFDQIGAWITYIFDLAIIYGSIHFILIVSFLMARNYRTLKESHDYFKKDLKALKEAKMKNNVVHNKKPTEEMQEMIDNKEV